MISHLRNTILEKEASTIVLDVGGVGYSVELATNDPSSIGQVGNEATIYTYLHVRDDGWQLFGFSEKEEKSIFEKLISISGIGPKLALSILSSYSIDDFKKAIAIEDADFLASVPRLGSKNAKRIILELKGKLLTEDIHQAPHLTEAKQALQNLGYSNTEINKALAACDGEKNAEELVKKALRSLANG